MSLSTILILFGAGWLLGNVTLILVTRHLARRQEAREEADRLFFNRPKQPPPIGNTEAV